MSKLWYWLNVDCPEWLLVGVLSLCGGVFVGSVVYMVTG